MTPATSGKEGDGMTVRRIAILAIVLAAVSVMAASALVPQDASADGDVLERVQVDSSTTVSTYDISDKEITFSGNAVVTVSGTLTIDGTAVINASGEAIRLAEGASVNIAGMPYPVAAGTTVAVDGSLRVTATGNSGALDISVDIGDGDTFSVGGYELTGGQGTEIAVTGTVTESGITASVRADVPTLRTAQQTVMEGYTIESMVYDGFHMDIRIQAGSDGFSVGGSNGKALISVEGSESVLLMGTADNGTRIVSETGAATMRFTGSMAGDRMVMDIEATQGPSTMTLSSYGGTSANGMSIETGDITMDVDVTVGTDGIGIGLSVDASGMTVKINEVRGTTTVETVLDSRDASVDADITLVTDALGLTTVDGLDLDFSVGSATITQTGTSGGRTEEYLSAGVTYLSTDSFSVSDDGSVRLILWASVVEASVPGIHQGDVRLESVTVDIGIDGASSAGTVSIRAVGFSMVSAGTDVSGNDLEIVIGDRETAVSASSIHVTADVPYDSIRTLDATAQALSLRVSDSGSVWYRINDLDVDMERYNGDPVLINGNLTYSDGNLTGTVSMAAVPGDMELDIVAGPGMNYVLATCHVSSINAMAGSDVNGNVLLTPGDSITLPGGTSLTVTGEGVYAEVEMHDSIIESATLHLMPGYSAIPQYSGIGCGYSVSDDGRTAVLTDLSGDIAVNAQPNEHRIAADGNEYTVAVGGTVTVPAPADTPDGMRFAGWTDGMRTYEGTEVTLDLDLDLSLTPVWEVADATWSVVDGECVVDAAGSQGVSLDRTQIESVCDTATKAGVSDVVFVTDNATVRVPVDVLSAQREFAFLATAMTPGGILTDGVVRDTGAVKLVVTGTDGNPVYAEVSLTVDTDGRSASEMRAFALTQFGLSKELGSVAEDNGDGTATVTFVPDAGVTSQDIRGFYGASAPADEGSGNGMLLLVVVIVVIAVVFVAAAALAVRHRRNNTNGQ